MSSHRHDKKCRHKHKCANHFKDCDAKVRNMKVKGDLVVDGCICTGCANIDTKCTLGSVINGTESINTPSDTNSAVGLERVVSAVNLLVAINDKRTGERKSICTTQDFFDISLKLAGNTSDPVVTYDEFSERFICVMWETVNLTISGELTITDPGGISGNYPGSRSVRFPVFDTLVFPIEKTIPADASTILANDLTGKIALIESNSFQNAGSVTKVGNAATAGAAAAIIYNTEGEFIYSISGNAAIPSISISQSAGQLILDNILNPVTASMRSLPPDEVGLNGYSVMHIAVSKTSTPNSKDDFFIYTLGKEGGVYARIGADFPKIGVDDVALYFSTNSFHYPRSPDFLRSSQIVAIEKAPLLDGSSPTNITDILLNDQILTNPNDPITLGSNMICAFRLPSLLRPPKTDVPQVTFFVKPVVPNLLSITLPASGSSVEVTMITNILTAPVIQTVIVQVEPWTCKNLFAGARSFNNTAPQPKRHPDDPDYNLDLIPVIMNYRVIFYKDSLWCTHTVQPTDGSEIYEVRWYEIDVSNALNPGIDLQDRITLKQQGTVKAGGNTNAFYSSIDVDRDGNMGLGLNISGDDQPITMAHTGRLCNDPSGTVRYPLQTNFEGTEYPYRDFSWTGSNFSKRDGSSRWNDYTSTVLDPSDGKTFWFSSSYSNMTEADFISRNGGIWNTGLVTWCVDDTKGKTKTKPGQEPHICKPVQKICKTKNVKEVKSAEDVSILKMSDEERKEREEREEREWKVKHWRKYEV